MVRNAVALYGVHVAGLVLPLVTIPYLARVLRPEVWGLVVFAQSFAAWLTLLVEYGFVLSATRTIARVRDDRARVAEVVGEVQGAKLVLLAALVGLGAASYGLVPVFQRHPDYLALAGLIAAVQGFSPLWYFQGVERMRGVAGLEVFAKVAATAGVFLLVREPEDGWLVLALQAGTGAMWVGMATVWLYREVPRVRTGLRRSIEMLRETAALFFFRGAVGMYSQANAFILGIFAVPTVVAHYGGAEKIIRAGIGFVRPASQALYPRMSYLVSSSTPDAARLLRRTLYGIGGLGAAIGLGAALLAPVLVRVLLGPGYEAAVPVLRVFALLPPIIAVGTVLGIQWALPLGLDRYFLRFAVGAGALNIGLAIFLVPRYGSIGMAVSVVLAEACVASWLLALAWHRGDLWRHGRLPLPDQEIASAES